MYLLTADQHRQVLERLVGLAESASNFPRHTAGIEYTSLMTCFLLHNLTCARALRALIDSFGYAKFPATAGFGLVRPLFETEVTAHYISVAPVERSRQYIDFAHVLNKREMDACEKHRHSQVASWREGMEWTWKELWASREEEINREFTRVEAKFRRTAARGKSTSFRNWSGKSLKEMAAEVDHIEAYDVFYTFLSSFTHADVRLADRFLRYGPHGLEWSDGAREFDVGNVLRHAATFLTCFLELMASEFSVWTKSQVHACWRCAV